MRIMIAAVLLALGTAPGLAGQTEAKACAGGLDANAQLIFNDVLPQVSASTDLRTAVKDATRSLVMGGKIARADAKPAAMAAGECLKLAK